MGKEDLRFIRRESGLTVPSNGHVTSEAVGMMFGIDLKERVTDRLRAFGFLPDGHELTFFSKGQEHIGSQARYFVEEEVEEHMVYVSFLGPDSKTSIHKHEEPLFENYFWLGGESFLQRGNGNHKLGQGQEVIRVSPGIPHQLTTREKSSLVLIVMENAARVPANKLHVPATI